jgi:hypothetical protein
MKTLRSLYANVMSVRFQWFAIKFRSVEVSRV